MNGAGSDSWSEYWNSQKIEQLETPYWTDFYVESLLGLGILSSDDVVLDFGAGWGTVSDRILPFCKELYALDSSERMRNIMRNRFEKTDKLHVVASIEEIPGPVDVVIVNSVFQYIPMQTGIEILKSFGDKCTSDSRVVLSDLIPISYSKVADLLFLILHTAVAGKLLEFASHVLRAVRQSSDSNLSDKLERYESGFITTVLRDSGFDVELLPRNLTPSSKRYSILARKTSRHAK